MRYYASRGNAPFGETACVAHVYHILYYKVKSKKKKCHKNATIPRAGSPTSGLPTARTLPHVTLYHRRVHPPQKNKIAASRAACVRGGAEEAPHGAYRAGLDNLRGFAA